MRRKLILIFLIFIMSLLASALIVGCSDASWGSYYNSNVTSICGDGIDVVDSYDAPSNATEYIGVARVKQNLTYDIRLKGIHSTGLYLPKGESLNVSVPSDITGEVKLVINCNNNAQEFLLNTGNNTVEIEEGGIVGVVSNAIKPFTLTIEGASLAPYFRYGVDFSLRRGAGTIAVLESENLAIYLPTEHINEDTNLTNTMAWWRNASKIIDEITGSDEKLALYFGNFDNISTTPNTISIPLEYVQSGYDYSTLINGEAFDILQAIAKIKIEQTNKFEGKFASDEMDYILAALVTIYSSDQSSIYLKQREDGFLFNEYETALMLNKNQLTESEKIKAYFLFTAFTFGNDALSTAIKTLAYDDTVVAQSETEEDVNLEKFYNILTKQLDRDISTFTNILMGSSFEGNDKTDFIAVASKYTYGQFERSNGEAVTVPMGVAYTFDFESNIVALGSDFEVVSVLGRETGWQDYSYHPDATFLMDSFILTVKVDNREVQLYGNIKVDVHVAANYVYDDVNYRNIDTAVKKYKNDYVEPHKVLSVDTASCENGETSIFGNTYSFAVGEGCVEVSETGKYALYLKSRGICRVDFGVTQYSSTIFSNSLTVNSFTEELKYEITLEKGVSYYYTIYLLTTSGDGRAELAIKKLTDVIVVAELDAINGDNLFYKGITNIDIVDYQPIIIENKQNIIDSFCYPSDTSRWSVINIPYGKYSRDESKALYDASNETYYEAEGREESQIFEIDTATSNVSEYVGFEIADVVGIYRIYLKNVSANEYGEPIVSGNTTDIPYVDYEKKIRRLEYRLEEDFEFRYIQIEFILDNVGVVLYEVETGKIFKESTLVPNTDEDFKFEGDWVRDSSYIAVNGSLTRSTGKNAKVTYKFYGSAFAIFGATGQEFGDMTLYIDDKEFIVINLSNETSIGSKRLFCFDFGEVGEHVISLASKNRTNINFDYLAVHFAQQEEKQADYSKLWLISIIPGILLIAMVVCIILDVRGRKEKEIGTNSDIVGIKSDEGLYTPKELPPINTRARKKINKNN